MQLFSADAIVFSKKIQNLFWAEKYEKTALKSCSDPFISQSSQDHSPQPKINFSYYEISGPDICSLICVRGPSFTTEKSSQQLRLFWNARKIVPVFTNFFLLFSSPLLIVFSKHIKVGAIAFFWRNFFIYNRNWKMIFLHALAIRKISINPPWHDLKICYFQL